MLKNSTQTRQVKLDRQTRLLRHIHTADNLIKIKLLQELQQSIQNLEVKIEQVINIKR